LAEGLESGLIQVFQEAVGVVYDHDLNSGAGALGRSAAQGRLPSGTGRKVRALEGEATSGNLGKGVAALSVACQHPGKGAGVPHRQHHGG
jgi:hypothetical protein